MSTSPASLLITLANRNQESSESSSITVVDAAVIDLSGSIASILHGLDMVQSLEPAENVLLP